MKEPAIGTPNRDDTEALGAERLEPIWSELDFISNGDLNAAIFASSDNKGVGMLDPGNVKKLEDGNQGVGQEEIGADFWTRKEAKDCTLEHQQKMDGLVKVKEEPTEVVSQQGIVMDGPQRSETGLVHVKEEVRFGDWMQGKAVTGLSTVKHRDGTSQNRLPEGTGAVMFKVKEEQGTEQDECQVAEVTGPLEDTEMDEVEQTADATIADVEFVDLPREGNEEEGTAGGSGAIAGIVNPSAQASKEAGAEDSQCLVSRAEGSTAMVVQPPQYEVRHVELGGLLKDGVLSSDGLAKKGMVLTDDSSSDEESESSEEEDESESDDSSDDSSSSSEEEDMKTIKEKIRRSSDETKEDAEPPRTKHELSVLPPVPKVEVVLEPHHVCVSTGVISSVVDRYIVVEGEGDSKVLGDGSILWLTESRVPLGIVDEVFGPVKKPYYSLRFNEVSDIHEFATVGADVAYVAEFAEFVLKDNPNLYKKAIDASGLDDEELSDAEIEFSDDEKEMAAKQRERGKRCHDSKENGGQAWDSSESQPPEAKGRWQRRERGRGRGHSRGPHMAEGVGSAMADMDLHGLSFSAGSINHRGRARSRPGAGRSKFQSNIRQSNSGGWDGQDLGATYSRLHEGLSRVDWVPSPTRHSPGAGPSTNGAHHQIPMLRRDERRDGPWYSEQVDLADRQQHQAVGIQGLPSFGVAPLHRHLQGPGGEPRQPVGSRYPAFGYSSVTAPQIATDGQGNFFHITGPVNLPPDVGNVSRMGMNVAPTMVRVLPPSSPNSYSQYNSPVQGTLNVRQGGYDPVYQADLDHRGQHGGFMGPSPGYSNRMAAPEFRFQAMPSNSPIDGPGGAGGPQASGYALGSPPHSHRQRYQGSRGR